MAFFRFHSIGFPCERGDTVTIGDPGEPITCVSIQLVSPARGELDYSHFLEALAKVSIQLVSPARGEYNRVEH